MLIFIPSRSRAHLIGRGPLKQLPGDLKPVFVVPDDQYDRYLKQLGDVLKASNFRLVSIDPTWKIAEKRRWIGEEAARRGEPYFMMLDDDIGFLVRRSATNWQLREADPTEVAGMLAAVTALLRDGCSHVGISAREGNNRVGVGTPHGLMTYNTRLMRAVAWNTEVFNRLEHGRVPVMEDFDLSLQALRAGERNAALYYWAQGQRETGESGGCADWRTLEVHEAAARELARLHAPHVRLRQKKNKGGGLAERLEVTIAWKMAAREGEDARNKGA